MVMNGHVMRWDTPVLQFREGFFSHDASMGLVYLPTFGCLTIKIYHTWMVWVWFGCTFWKDVLKGGCFEILKIERCFGEGFLNGFRDSSLRTPSTQGEIEKTTLKKIGSLEKIVIA